MHNVQKSVEAAEKSWLETPHFQTRDDLPREDIDRFFEVIAPRLAGVKGDSVIRIPNNKSCTEFTRKEGGVKRALLTEWVVRSMVGTNVPIMPMKPADYAKRPATSWSEKPGLLSKKGAAWDYYAKAGNNPRPGDGPLSEIFRLAADEKGEPPTPLQLLLMSLRVEQENHAPNPIRATPIRERGGKVRVASKHPATEAYACRIAMQRMVPILRALDCTRFALKGDEIKLRGESEEEIIYSADLSKATDRIDHELARYFWSKICTKSNQPAWVHQVGELAFRRKQNARTQDVTSRGIHMGLGISWIVLSLVNMYAAWSVGARRESYRICGDDLVGLWTGKMADDYELKLEKLGLKANRQKSFRSQVGGVFCEKLVRRTGVHTAHSTHFAKISEIGAARYVGGLDRSRAAALEGINASLPKAAFLTRLGTRMRSKLAFRLKGLRAGPIAVGGDGSASQPTTYGQVRSLLKRGPIKLKKETLEAHKTRQVFSDFSASVHYDRSSGTPREDIRNTLMRSFEFKRAHVHVTDIVRDRDIQAKLRTYAGGKVTRMDLLATVAASKDLTGDDRNKIRYYSRFWSPSKLVRRVWRAYHNRRQRLVDKELGEEILKQYALAADETSEAGVAISASRQDRA
jgi:hypothetical protein